MKLRPVQLVDRLRSQARAMKAGPDSLLIQAADVIEQQQQQLSDQTRQLLIAARLIADVTLLDDTPSEGER